MWKESDEYRTFEGEWKNGELHGKVVENSRNGGHQEYEAKDGKIHGKFTR